MINTRIQKSIFIVGLLLCASVIIALFPSGVRADHFDAENPNPCDAIAEFEQLDLPELNLRELDGSGEVPVFDDDVIIALNNMQSLLLRVSEFSQSEELEARISSNYLRLLCEKEYDFDHTLRHAWAEVIDQFVLETIDWVQTVYNDNPIFVTNQSVYYKLVDKNVFSTLVQEVAVSQIGPNNKRDILKYLFTNRFVDVFPYPLVGDTFDVPEFAPDELPDNLQRFYTEEEWNRLTKAEGNVVGVINIAQTELDRRIKETRTNEVNKLNWGRGFFSYEICDLEIFGRFVQDASGADVDFAGFPEDRRNCRVVTPGSLIQDQVSFVLGSALRQMELADEVDEWVSANASLVLRNVLGDYGLNFGGEFSAQDSSREFGVYFSENTGAGSPERITELISENTATVERLVEIATTNLEDDPDGDGRLNGTFYPLDFLIFQETQVTIRASAVEAARHVNILLPGEDIDLIPSLD